MDVACSGFERVAEKKIDVTNYRCLVRQISYVGLNVIRAVTPAHFDVTLEAHGLSFDESLDLFERRFLDLDLSTIQQAKVIEYILEQGIWRHGDSYITLTWKVARAQPMVQQILSREGRRD
jgi:hypothetical protein